MEQMGIEDADMSDGRMLADTVYCLGYRLPATGVTAGDDLRDRVAALHPRISLPEHHKQPGSAPDVCGTCWDQSRGGPALYPCPTVAALVAPVVSRPEVEVKAAFMRWADDHCEKSVEIALDAYTRSRLAPARHNDTEGLIDRWSAAVDAWEVFTALNLPPSAAPLRANLIDLMEKLAPVVTAVVSGDDLRDRVAALAYSPEADEFRDQACRHAVVHPYTENRYVRLLDDLRAVLTASSAPVVSRPEAEDES